MSMQRRIAQAPAHNRIGTKEADGNRQTDAVHAIHARRVVLYIVVAVAVAFADLQLQLRLYFAGCKGDGES